MLDGRLTIPEDWTSADIAAACARGTGVGADGIVFVMPGSQPGSARMIYFNSDGTRAAMCGNAALCSARFATRLEIASGPGMRLETDAGSYEARSGPGADQAELNVGAVDAPRDVPGLTLEPGEQRMALVTVGVPHLIVVVEDIDAVDLAKRGRALRFSPALGPGGANANFVSPSSTPGEWRMRTYERGVEGETLACGTGAVAAACALDAWKLAQLPLALLTRAGRRLEVRAKRIGSGAYEDTWLAGEARLVFRGVLT